jgi:NADH:ubiquinone oxidoreductase subunit E
MPDRPEQDVVVCLGSSCFARGNAQNLSTLESYLQSHNLCECVQIRGSLCQDACKQGPNLTVSGTHYHDVNAAKLREILQRLDRGEQ